ncbi:MAG: hypothetical protein KDC98_07540 [Planctomycetes bacterium]|nr:hypothetical protein [Planctomycetota bacterium]
MQLNRLLITATIASGTVAGIRAQVNPFVFFPQDPQRQTITCASYVGRPDVGNRAEALMVLDPEHFQAVGALNNFVRLSGIYHWVADERLSTPETYDLVVRDGATAGGPDMSAAGERLRIAGLLTPPSSNSQRGTWIMYDGFGIPFGLMIGQSPFQPEPLYIGVDLPANPLWPSTDGHALFRADLIGANTAATVGENERPGAPDPTWAGLQSAPSFSTPWTYILGPFVTSANLHVGGIDPTSSRLGTTGANLAMNGLFPDIGGNPRRDGLMVRVTDSLWPFAFSILGGNIGFQTASHLPLTLASQPNGFSVIGGPGNAPILLGLATMQNGVREFPLALPGTIPAAFVGLDLALQAIQLELNLNVADYTNGQAVHL